MKQTISVILFCLVAAASALAQNTKPQPENKPATPAKAAEAMPTVDQVLDKYIQATGGKAAIEKITSTSRKGSFEIPAMGASGTLEVYAKAPNKNVTIIDIPGFGVVQQGYNGTVAWSQEPTSGLREITGPELADFKRRSEFHREIKLKQLYPKMELKGKEKVGEREAYVIEATPTDGKPEKMFFDTQTGLLVRSESDIESPQGAAHIVATYEDYRDVDGVKVPFTITVARPEISYILKATEVKSNVAIDDAKFNKPATQ